MSFNELFKGAENTVEYWKERHDIEVEELKIAQAEIAALRELIDRSDLEQCDTKVVQVGGSSCGDGKPRLYHKSYAREVKKCTELLQQRANDARKIAALKRQIQNEADALNQIIDAERAEIAALRGLLSSAVGDLEECAKHTSYQSNLIYRINKALEATK